MLFVNKFYVSLITFPLSQIKQLGKSFLLRSLLFFMAYWAHTYFQAEPVTLFWEIYYTESISCHACRIKYLGEDNENISIYMMK